MGDFPQIRGPKEVSEFHDGRLHQITFDAARDVGVAIVSTPDTRGAQRVWQIEMYGILRMEMETIGDGEPSSVAFPPEVYDIYRNDESDERKRWTQRLKTLGTPGEVVHLVFASSFLRGWGERALVEGINVVCRRVVVRPASHGLSV